MSRNVIETKNAPAAIGPYSQAVVSGQTVFVSGQIPINPENGELVEGDITAQSHQVMKNLKAVLEAAGTGFDKVIKMQIFLKDMDDFGAVNEVYGSYLSQPYPARACVEVARLPKNVAVEIDAIANI